LIITYSLRLTCRYNERGNFNIKMQLTVDSLSVIVRNNEKKNLERRHRRYSELFTLSSTQHTCRQRDDNGSRMSWAFVNDRQEDDLYIQQMRKPSFANSQLTKRSKFELFCLIIHQSASQLDHYLLPKKQTPKCNKPTTDESQLEKSRQCNT
jgi:hypothetical protein